MFWPCQNKRQREFSKIDAMKIKSKAKRSNRRVGIVNGIEGGLAQLGYFTPQVQRVVRRWPRVPPMFVHEYYFAVASAALWKTNEASLKVYARAHWPLVWQLAAACDQVRRIPPTHPAHWLLKLPLFIWTINPSKGEVSWGEIPWGDVSQEIVKRGGKACDFSATTLRQHAKRLRLVAPSRLAEGFLKSGLV
jgi:hypothetical protein